MNSYLKAHPFNNREIRLVSKLAYLQNIRSGLSYRIGITKQNKLTYFTFMQTKKQVQEIGLDEIHSRKQFNLAHSAYFRAYHKTLQAVNKHYEQMFKTFTRKQPLNTIGIRFDSTTLANLYLRNLKEEVSQIAHLINSPLSKTQLEEVTQLVAKINKAKMNIADNQRQIDKIQSEMKHFDKNNINYQKNIKSDINKSKIYNNNIINERKYITKLQSKINTMVSNARSVEETYETQK
ncbi:MAG: hypothetical protein MJ219_01915 [Mycoplasmoidaceae bacterium]|nr:hypothetical protein [Mycoplasmoidaceae bacterium]